MFVIVFLHDVTGLNWIDRVLSIEVTVYYIPLHDTPNVRKTHEVTAHTVVNNRVLSTEVIQYTFLLHDVIAIWDEHILSLHSAVNYSL